MRADQREPARRARQRRQRAVQLCPQRSAGFELGRLPAVGVERHEHPVRSGKQAGPDTIAHFLGGGAEGHAAMANWLKGGFEMDRQGHWRLKPQVADTLQRYVQAVMAQTGWQRSIDRSAQDQTTIGTSIEGSISSSVHMSGPSASRGHGRGGGGAITGGGVDGNLGFESSDRGTTSETADATIDIMSYDIRGMISSAGRAAAGSHASEQVFAARLAEDLLGGRGMLSRCLIEADSARGTVDITAPLTSIEQSSLLKSGRFSTDLAHGPFDGTSNSEKP